MTRSSRFALIFVLVGFVVASCVVFKPHPTESPVSPRAYVAVCGRLFPTQAPVIRWDQAHGYNAYAERCWFDRQNVLPSSPAPECDTPRRYSERACLMDGDTPIHASPRREYALVRANVDQIVIHYDAAGSSRRCFAVLHDERGLSSHFLLDVDGTVYQTLDVRERARHAGPANDRSVGIEIANVGAYDDLESLHKVAQFAFTGVPRGGGTAPPDDSIVTGEIQSRTLYQYPFTEAQYRSLIELLRTLRRALPRVRAELPRDRRGVVIDHTLDDDAWSRYRGILGHFHVSPRKVDPGPAFDWGRVLRGLSEKSD